MHTSGSSNRQLCSVKHAFTQLAFETHRYLRVELGQVENSKESFLSAGRFICLHK